MPKEREMRKGIPEKPEGIENQIDDAKSKEEEIEEIRQEEAIKEFEQGKED